MPNGDHDFETKIKPELDAFFAPIAPQIVAFASHHNLRLGKYYHQWHQWDLSFRHPRGGVCKIDLMKDSETTIKIGFSWWIDDYDEGTRSAKSGAAEIFSIYGTDLPAKLGDVLRQILDWKVGEWTMVNSGFKECWHRIPRDKFEDRSLYPVPKTPR